MPVMISPEALDGLRGIGEGIARDCAARAVTFPTEPKRRFTLPAENPLNGRRREELGTGLRSLPRGTRVVFCRLAAGGIEIVRVPHGHGDLPGGPPPG